jgi:fermentation-respiration switch protein FrsA (DUF1100 family)
LPLTPAAISSEAVRALKDLKIAEEDHVNPTNKPVIKDDNWPRTIDDIEEYLRNHLGQTKIPLAYIVSRKDENVPPPHGNDPLVNYTIAQNKLFAQALHYDANDNHTELFNNDNHQVWTLLVE